MRTKKDYISLLLCYVLWGFQPLYWGLLTDVDSYVILAVRIVLAAVFSVLLLAVTHRLDRLKAVFTSRRTMRILLPAVVFLFLDWAVFLVAVNAGHVLDASLGYYINLLCGLLMGESFSPSQIVSLLFFLAAVVLFSVDELRQMRTAPPE